MYRIQVDGTVRCVVEDLNPKGKKTVLFVHGWPLTREIFEYQYDVLPEYGIRCVSYDIRGYGDSDRPYEGYNYNRLADDLCKIIDSLNVRCVTLCGFSMGGAVCARYMSRHRGHKVNKLILCGAACPLFVQQPGFPYGMTREQVDGYIYQAYHDRPQLCDTFGRMCFAQPVSEPYLDWYSGLCLKAAGHSTIKCLVSLRDEDLRQDMGKIKVPTAIFHGVRDQICPFPLAQEMNKGIPNSYVVPFENSGHALFRDERDKFNSQLIDFVNSN